MLPILNIISFKYLGNFITYNTKYGYIMCFNLNVQTLI